MYTLTPQDLRSIRNELKKTPVMSLTRCTPTAVSWLPFPKSCALIRRYCRHCQCRR